MKRFRSVLAVLGVLCLLAEPGMIWAADMALTPDGKIPGTPFQALWDAIKNIPSGPAGPQGEQGHQGLQGEPGIPGAAGPPGESVVSEPLDPGHPMCPTGGVMLRAGTATSFICNGKSGAGLPSIEALKDLSCNVGEMNEGKVVVDINPNTNAIAMYCNPTGYGLTITGVTTSQSYQCGSHQEAYPCGPLNMDRCYRTVPTYCTVYPAFSVVSDPAGVQLTVGGMNGLTTDKKSFRFPASQSVTLSSDKYTAFSGDCVGAGTCTLFMDGPHNVTATYNPTGFPLTVTAIAKSYQYQCGTREDSYPCGPLNMDRCYRTVPAYCTGYNVLSVSSDPAGIEINVGGASGTSTSSVTSRFPQNESVTLTSEPDTVFSGDCVGVGSCTVFMDGLINITATR